MRRLIEGGDYSWVVFNLTNGLYSQILEINAAAFITKIYKEA